MTTTVDERVENAAQHARAQIRRVFEEKRPETQPAADFCENLVDWVFYGERKPNGEPTDDVRRTVKNAINSGLDCVYGGHEGPWIDLGIRARRGAL